MAPMPAPFSRGVTAPPEALARAFYDADDALPRRHDLGDAGLEETVRLQCADTAEVLMPGRPEAARTVAEGFLADSRRMLRRNGPMLDRLRSRYRLGIVSNFYGNLEAVLASEGLRHLFGAVADSERVGAQKPDAALFRWALERLGTAPAETLMVGDSLRRDMAGAEAAGLPHAWLAGPKAGARPCCPGTPVLRSLLDLEALL